MSDDRGCDVDLAPLDSADGTPHTFATWYLSWLAEAEAQAGTTR